MAIYLSGICGDTALRDEFQDRYRQSGLRMDMGKSCVRFKKLKDLPLDVIGWAVGALTMEQFIAMHDQAQSLGAKNASPLR